ASATDTASAINRLTNQYLYNIAGKKYAGSAAGASAAAQKAIQVALAHLGNPYVWGAEGPNSFDCSGLMQFAAAQAGVRIPRVASDQYQQLQKVNPADIRPGDLIFPDSEFNNGNPGHVMMYIGNGQCVEAPHTGAVVRRTNLPSGYHASRWS
ncbi:C40 family peptidase, partial [Nocardia sp. NPDC005998]|uniref:C40 family peptidase n=1 Tax=Nocardia sp. NPDC005998 TaxID=3156894 RepID=UPI0033BD09D9